MQRVIQTLSRWYNLESRDLPWRHTNDPYKIWISEVILQQTRVAQGIGYYERFIVAMPNVSALSEASEQEVLKLWQGLGYYSRARNLHASAKQVMDEFHGVFPSNYTDILRLRGVGKYTAAAIASFAFGEKVPAIDGNVKRVGARLFGLYDAIHTSAFEKSLFSLLFDAIQGADPNIFNQAMIEVGATICLPQNPRCEICPLAEVCVAHLQQLQKQIPVVVKKQKPIAKHFYYLCIQQGERWAFASPRSGGIWQGLVEFPMVEGANGGMGLDEILTLAGVVDNFSVLSERTFTHQLTHQTIYATCWYLCLSDDKFVSPVDWQWCNLEEIQRLPLHRLMEKMIKFTL